MGGVVSPGRPAAEFYPERFASELLWRATTIELPELGGGFVVQGVHLQLFSSFQKRTGGA